MNITAIVITYNPNCLSLFNNIDSYIDNVTNIYVIDNSINQSIKENIKFNCNKRKIFYHDMEGNHGIASALNKGFNYAINNNSNWVLTMDQDSFFKSNLKEFKSYIINNDCSDIIFLTPFYNYHNLNKDTKIKKNKEVNLIPQSGSLVNVLNFIKIGFYRDDFFIDFVDYEYCLRAKSKHFKILQISNEILIHESGICSTTSIFGFKYNYFESVPFRYYFVVRNGLKTAFEYKNILSLFIVIKTITRITLLERNKIIKLKFAIRGFIDFIKSKEHLLNV